MDQYHERLWFFGRVVHAGAILQADAGSILICHCLSHPDGASSNQLQLRFTAKCKSAGSHHDTHTNSHATATTHYSSAAENRWIVDENQSL